MKRILVICPYPENCAPSQRLKYEQYFAVFRESGYEVVVSPFVNRRFWAIIYKKGFWLAKIWFTLTGYFNRFLDIIRIRRFDIVYVHLWVTPIGFPFFEWLTCKLARNVVYDIDDMVYLGHSSQANKALKTIKGRRKMILLMRLANHVITSTPALESFARHYNQHVSDIPTTLNVSDFPYKKDYGIRHELVLGYSGSHSTSKYLKAIEPAFDALLQSGLFPFRVLVVGDPDFHFDNPDIPVAVRRWTAESESDLLLAMDIGLYPLTDEPWVYGKRGGKALLYMAAGLPVIATGIGTNLDTFRHGENGLLAGVDDVQSWINNIILLAKDETLRQETGRKARYSVEQLYSVEANKNLYLQILEKLTKNKE